MHTCLPAYIKRQQKSQKSVFQIKKQKQKTPKHETGSIPISHDPTLSPLYNKCCTYQRKSSLARSASQNYCLFWPETRPSPWNRWVEKRYVLPLRIPIHFLVPSETHPSSDWFQFLADSFQILRACCYNFLEVNTDILLLPQHHTHARTTHTHTHKHTSLGSQYSGALEASIVAQVVSVLCKSEIQASSLLLHQSQTWEPTPTESLQHPFLGCIWKRKHWLELLF